MLDLIGSSLTVFVFLALLVIFVLFKTALVVPNQHAVVVDGSASSTPFVRGLPYPHPFH